MDFDGLANFLKWCYFQFLKMQQEVKPGFITAILLSIFLMLFLFFVMLSFNMLIAVIWGENSFTFGNEFFLQCMTFTLTVIIAVQISKFLHPEISNLNELFYVRPATFYEVILAVVASIGVSFPLSEIDNCLQLILPPVEAEKQMMMMSYNPSDYSEKIFVILSIIVAAPVGEEVVYRGAMLRWLTSASKGKWKGIIITAILFAISHILIPRSAILIVVVGILFGWLVSSTGSIFTSIAAHAAFNGFPLFAYWSGLRIQGYNSAPGQFTHLSPALWAGGAMIAFLCIALLQVISRKKQR